MCDWGGYDKNKVVIDAPSSLTQGIPDSTILKQIVEGHTTGVVPLEVIHRYLVYSGLLDQTVGYTDYVIMLKKSPINIDKDEDDLVITDDNGNIIGGKKKEFDEDGNIIQTASSKKTNKEKIIVDEKDAEI